MDHSKETPAPWSDKARVVPQTKPLPKKLPVRKPQANTALREQQNNNQKNSKVDHDKK